MMSTQWVLHCLLILLKSSLSLTVSLNLSFMLHGHVNIQSTHAHIQSTHAHIQSTHAHTHIQSTHVCTHTRAHTHTYMHTHTYNPHMHASTHACTHTRAHTHTYMHTHGMYNITLYVSWTFISICIHWACNHIHTILDSLAQDIFAIVAYSRSRNSYKYGCVCVEALLNDTVVFL